ncbi:uncharacterized protein FA14DRAFT_82486 [Meira miltonrushii]|uniref:Uncharacterized protein n=1 Tax=Meira miltonrushii TaxID=1280837 RepID=A0A316V2W8_9BASI|nr:uncharacterized protein FA14DRAFT_82486 [Meira miltonrushii]PWN31909.1 hypothetical protein FA14DRAFT_82486 [Meira miltonrushii]
MRAIFLITLLFQIMFMTSNATSRLGEWKEVEESIQERKPNNPPPCRPGVKSPSITVLHEIRPNKPPPCRPGVNAKSISLIHAPTAVIHTVQDGDSGKPAFDHKGKKPIDDHRDRDKPGKKSSLLKKMFRF